MLMKYLSFLFCFYVVASFAQKECLLKSQVGKVELKLNGNVYTIDSSYTTVKINYPKFDSVVLISNHHNEFLANFQPDSTYTIVLACCNSLDVVASYRADNDSLKYWDVETEHHKIQRVLLNSPKISLQLTENRKDSIFVWLADAACFPRLNRLSTKKWNYGIPEKCFFWNNITTFQFYKNEPNYPNFELGDKDTGFEFFPNEEREVLTSISFRLFDDKSYLITYDPKLNKAFLTQENK